MPFESAITWGKIIQEVEYLLRGFMDVRFLGMAIGFSY